MQNSSRWIRIGAVGMTLAILFGAFGVHALKGTLGEYEMSVFEKANYYHLTQSLGLLLVALVGKSGLVGERAALVTLRLLLAGIVIFSGSLYLLALTGVRTFGAITPIGGVCLILGWAVLALKAGESDYR